MSEEFDRMVGAVRQVDREVDDRESRAARTSGNRARRSRPTGCIASGTTPPVMVSVNWKPEPRGSGLMSMHHVAELAMAARLLLVAAALADADLRIVSR